MFSILIYFGWTVRWYNPWPKILDTSLFNVLAKIDIVFVMNYPLFQEFLKFM